MGKLSILDNTAAHLPNLFHRGDRRDLSLDKIIVTDLYLGAPLKNKYKYAWLVEPKCVLSASYDYIINNYYKFTKVITYDKEILESVPNSKFIPFGTTFIREEDFLIYYKSKLASMVSSSKNFTYGHSFRLKVLDYVKGKVDCYGRGINPVDYKLDCLKEYMFSIAVENSKHDYFFTEKLLDCFLTGTIPIYWGCPSIGKFFDLDGMLCFDSIEDLSKILESLSADEWVKRAKAIKTNFELAKKYINTYEDVYDYCESHVN